MSSPFNRRELQILGALRTPEKIQHFLDSLRYSVTHFARSPRDALRARRVHCLDGALIAAAAIEHHGGTPLIMDLRANEHDDDHVLAIYQRNGAWGSISKSNYSGLRSREPVYRTLRELAMSYFADYFNSARERSLREYSLPFDLRRWKAFDWRIHPEPVVEIAHRLDKTRHYRIITTAMERSLTLVDWRTERSGLFGAVR